MPRFDPVELARWCGGKWTPRAPADVTAVVHDTRSVTAGSLFVALRGTRVDGHDFIAQAAGQGAVGALVSAARVRGGLSVDVPLLVVDEPALALRALATGYRRRLNPAIVGVTGSVGKTTVKELIAAFLETTLPTARTRGNWNNEIGLPLSLLAMADDTRAGVLELGISHPGEMDPLCRIAQPDRGVITNVGPVHLEHFESVEAIAREKGRLFTHLPADGVAVVSLDEAYADLLKGMAGCPVVTTSLRAEADYRLVRSDEGRAGWAVRERASGDVFAFRTPLAGEHNLHNLLLAIAVARGFGVSWPAIGQALGRFALPAMRWERREIHEVTVINDAYNANPVSMRAAIRTFAELALTGRKWLVLGDMLELGQTGIAEHIELGRLVGGQSWAGLVTVGMLGGHIAEGALAGGMPDGQVQQCQTADEAADWLRERVRPGDGILVKASRGRRLEEVVARLEKGWGG
jgi:UDP-N-acetylmuramoyl-tripeptide--D-alanyl-D-alanine ligase